jgi:cytochrome b561
MAGSSWLAGTFAGIMVLTAAYCVSRLAVSVRQHRPSQHLVDAVHALMGVAMAGMLVPRLRVFWTGGWAVVFGAAAVWFAWQAARELRRQAPGRRRSHHLQHVLACAAMLYMLLAATSTAKTVSGGSTPSGMAGGAAHSPTLALVLAVALLGYVVWTADRLPALARVSALAARSKPAPALAAASKPAPALASAGAATIPAGTQPADEATRSVPRDDDQVPAGRYPGVPMSPRLSACCEIAMGVTMGYMLVLML